MSTYTITLTVEAKAFTPALAFVDMNSASSDAALKSVDIRKQEFGSVPLNMTLTGKGQS